MTDDELRRHFRELRSGLDSVSQGSILLAEAIGSQKELLEKLLEAVTAEPPKSELSKLLENMLNTLDVQTESIVLQTKSMDRVANEMENIGPAVEQAVIRGVSRASGITDDDGVILED